MFFSSPNPGAVVARVFERFGDGDKGGVSVGIERRPVGSARLSAQYLARLQDAKHGRLRMKRHVLKRVKGKQEGEKGRRRSRRR